MQLNKTLCLHASALKAYIGYSCVDRNYDRNIFRVPTFKGNHDHLYILSKRQKRLNARYKRSYCYRMLVLKHFMLRIFSLYILILAYLKSLSDINLRLEHSQTHTSHTIIIKEVVHIFEAFLKNVFKK